MGCDIHGPFVEQYHGGIVWGCLGWFYLFRNYQLFAAMAGVRGEGPTPKGLPDGVSWQVKDAYTLRVTDGLNQDEGSCCQGDAIRWIKEGASTLWPERRALVQLGDLITHPDWHSASWLSTAEVEAIGGPLAGCAARMRAAETYEHPCRIVFWFDN
jgi:hypothetical protein